jgi:quercetin dioxygenase-like cupin family protein
MLNIEVAGRTRTVRALEASGSHYRFYQSDQQLRIPPTLQQLRILQNPYTLRISRQTKNNGTRWRASEDPPLHHRPQRSGESHLQRFLQRRQVFRSADFVLPNVDSGIIESKMKANDDGIAFALSYTTKGFPVDLDNDKDLDVYGQYLKSSPGLVVSGGTVLRHVDLPPETECKMHRTVSLDYGCVLEGEVELLLDSGEKRTMKRGDVAIQRGTMHQWINHSKTEWTRMLFVLQESKPLSIAGQNFGEHLDGMPGVRSSD